MVIITVIKPVLVLGLDINVQRRKINLQLDTGHVKTSGLKEVIESHVHDLRIVKVLNHVEGDQQGNHVEGDQQGNHVEGDQQGNHVEGDQQGNHVEGDQQGNHVEEDQQGNHVEEDHVEDKKVQ